jgi:hypothetical protein
MPSRQLRVIVSTGPTCVGRLEAPDKKKLTIKIAVTSDAVCAAEIAEPVWGLGYGLDDPGFNSLKAQEIYIFSKTSRPAVGPTQLQVAD